ncbi:CcdB family protein [Marivita hallyeonensis]|uniref:Toxin CcdB n=1 Tax=Marivita hallyeonensis TaxID=996342 RepID=A0A1M5PEC5_9RHOB|nr:CcdB family protein [Marivita hallyeonensis]SHH00101.1 CcdB protein [Marivita hallyeonensis]
MARQFDVYRTTNDTYVLVLQSDTFDSLATRVVARLVPDDWPDPPLKNLSPKLALGDISLRVQMTQMATLTRQELGTYIGSAAHQRDEIIRATDLLLTDY